jgi:hypothetical protein
MITNSETSNILNFDSSNLSAQIESLTKLFSPDKTSDRTNDKPKEDKEVENYGHTHINQLNNSDKDKDKDSSNLASSSLENQISNIFNMVQNKINTNSHVSKDEKMQWPDSNFNYQYIPYTYDYQQGTQQPPPLSQVLNQYQYDQRQQRQNQYTYIDDNSRSSNRFNYYNGYQNDNHDKNRILEEKTTNSNSNVNINNNTNINLNLKTEKWKFDPSLLNSSVRELQYLAQILMSNLDCYELETRLIQKSDSTRKANTSIPSKIWNDMKNYYFYLKPDLIKEKYDLRDTYYHDKYRRREILKTIKDPKTNKDTKISSVEWIQKSRITSHDKKLCNRPLSFRVSLQKEKKIKNQPSTIDENTRPFRIQVKTVYAVSDKFSTVFFTENWISSNVEDIAQRKIIYNVEVEVNNSCIDPNKILPEEIVYNLLLRTLELQGLNGPLALTNFE